MEILKLIMYLMVFGVSTSIGVLLSQRYEKRVEELKEFKSSFIILRTKIRYTYAPLKDIFEDIMNSANGGVKQVFKHFCKYVDNENTTESWHRAVNETNLNITNEDKNVLYQLGKMLGKTDKDGQISQIDMALTFLDKQIEIAEEEKHKNAKLYKSLGVIAGMGIIIILL